MHKPGGLNRLILIPILWLMALLQAGCFLSKGQRYHHFSVPTPLVQGHTLILGFLGGREAWDNPRRGVRKLALKLRATNLPAVHIETVENKKRELALQLIHHAFDQNQDGTLEPAEKESARIILYGQSFGGAAVVRLAGQLNQMEIPVLLTVQVDSVGRDDAFIPPNVRRAANLYQDDGMIIQGESTIRAENPEKTEIIGNFKYDYNDKDIDLSEVSWFKRLFRTAHTKMDFDPEVWSRVEQLVLQAARTP